MKCDNKGSMELSNGMKKAFAILFCLIILKIGEIIILSPQLDDLAKVPEILKKGPRGSHPRCDACRDIAMKFDAAFREEDSKIEHLGLELTENEVKDIVNSVCTDYSFKYVELIEWEGYERLATPLLETWALGGRPALGGEGVNWPERLAKHCHYFADSMKGIEIYDLWLRTGHSTTQEWVEFMCEGEGIYGDCIREVGNEGWPAETCKETKEKERRSKETVQAYLNQRADM